MEDILFKILNPIFLFTFWIILNKKRFFIAWSIFLLINLLFLIISFVKFNDKEDNRS